MEQKCHHCQLGLVWKLGLQIFFQSVSDEPEGVIAQQIVSDWTITINQQYK